MTEKFTPEAREAPQQEPKLIDLSKELYEGGKADISKIGEYVEIAKQKGVASAERLDLTGGTMMVIYAAVSAEVGRPESEVQEFAFNNPGREGRIVLWTPEIANSAPEKPTKSLMIEAPASTIDPEAPQEVLDLRLTFADDPEAMQQMADPKKAEEYMKEVIAQIRELKEKGVDTVRITGIPMWLAQGGYFVGAREGMKRLISYTLSSEMIVYDADDASLVGKTETKIPKDIKVDLSDREIENVEPIRSGRALQEVLDTELSRNKIELKNLDLEKIPPQVGLRIFDSIHSFSSSLKLSEVEIFQHLDFRSHDLVPKTAQRNPDLLPKEQRTPIMLDVKSALKENDNDPEKTALALAKEAVNKASELTFSGITNELELAIAGKVAHAAHGLIEELRYQDEEGEKVVKSWKSEQKES
jgi:hypothetical protein